MKTAWKQEKEYNIITIGKTVSLDVDRDGWENRYQNCIAIETIATKKYTSYDNIMYGHVESKTYFMLHLVWFRVSTTTPRRGMGGIPLIFWKVPLKRNVQWEISTIKCIGNVLQFRCPWIFLRLVLTLCLSHIIYI